MAWRRALAPLRALPGLRFQASLARSPDELLSELRRLVTKADGSIAGVQQLSNEAFTLLNICHIIILNLKNGSRI